MHLPIILNILYVFGILASTYIVHKVITAILRYLYVNVAKKTKTTFDDEFVPLLQRILSIVVWCIGIIQILTYFNVDIKVVAAMFSVGPLLIAICVKDSIKNILSGVVIMTDRPFRVGDTVRIDKYERGKVLKIGLRRTHLLIDDGNESAYLVLTNDSISSSKIINYTYAEENRDADSYN